MNKWKKDPSGIYPNLLLRGERFCLSYNPAPCFNMPGLLTDNGSSETALYDEERNECLVLNGDYRKEYEAVAHFGLNACLEVYNKHKSGNRSSWSTDEEII